MPTDIEAVPNNELRWITAIQKVSPKSGPFWYDYGQRYNEKVTMQISSQRDPQGKRYCNVMIFTHRTIGDVVLSAWKEYSKYLVTKEK